MEPYLVDLLQSTDFMPAQYSQLLNAFKKLDTKNTGMIKLDRFVQMIKDSSDNYLPDEIETFIDALPKDTTGKFFYYEDYVYQLVETTNKHVDNIYKVNLVSKDKKSKTDQELQ